MIPDSTCDFLEEELPRKYFDCIVANPPYNKAREFVLKGFEYADIQWHFLRLSFLEGQKRYDELFSLGHCTHVFIFTYRVSCDKGYDREPTANSVCYAWFRFDKNFKGNPTLYWLTKED
jgi:DNA modification methylase